MESDILKEIIENRLEHIKIYIEFKKEISKNYDEEFIKNLIKIRNLKLGYKSIWDVELDSCYEMLNNILDENEMINRKTNELIKLAK